jgi:hypothetical protein
VAPRKLLLGQALPAGERIEGQDLPGGVLETAEVLPAAAGGVLLGSANPIPSLQRKSRIGISGFQTGSLKNQNRNLKIQVGSMEIQAGISGFHFRISGFRSRKPGLHFYI